MADDDAIVVVVVGSGARAVRNRVQQMNVPAALRVKLGDDAAESLADMCATAQAQSDVRLAQEICSFRVEMHQGMAQIRHEVATSRVEILKWMIGLWIVHLSATIGIISFVLRR